ncbi:hypothetical protein [Streptomyces sp. NPDC048606]|uniref:hypothetical protein n=1 Tax=Streptomyces sp. NPDC048606 TaxID=3154726 RepID=UPI003442D6C0
MGIEKARPAPGGEGCLVGVLRVPIKIVAVLVVLPVRVVWDLLVAAARAVHRHVLGPAGAALSWLLGRLWNRLLRPLLLLVLHRPWVALWRHVVAPAASALHRRVLRPVGRGLSRVIRAFGRHVLLPLGSGGGWLLRLLLLRPLARLHRHVLTPLGRGLRWLLPRMFAAVFVWPWVALWKHVVAPTGRGLLWLAGGLWRYVAVPTGKGLLWLMTALWRYVLGPPLELLYRWVLLPLVHLLVGAWHLAGRLTRALGRGLRWLWRGCVARPAAWAYRRVATPVGHVVREVWRTARAAVRDARAEVRRALFGAPPREPARSRARSLGSTTAAGPTPAPEISPPARRG